MGIKLVKEEKTLELGTPTIAGGSGIPGAPGKDGASAYEIAVKNGFEGTEQEWLKSLEGAPGQTGPTGAPGKDGRDGVDGKDGYTPIKGIDYFDGEPGIDGADGAPGEDGKDGYTPIKGVDYFDGAPGKDGEKGEPGYTPVKGVDYFDGEKGEPGYTPIKGIDYFDGEPGKDGAPGKDGKDGADGYTPIKGVDYFDGEPGAPGKDGRDGVDGYTPVKGKDYFDGEPGAPGKDGKDGEPGKDGYTPVKGVDYFDGVDGVPGQDGIDGYTPIKGVDYYTEADKNEFSEYIATELAKRGQLKPEPAQSLADMTDTSLMYVLLDKTNPDYGFIYAYILTEKEIPSDGYKNWLPLATETYNGTTIYGGVGYDTDVRLSSSGGVTTSGGEGMLATGFIPASDGARIRTVGFATTNSSMSSYVITYKKDGTKIAHKTWLTADNYISDFTLDSATYGTEIAFIRISSYANASLPTIVTVNEEIKEGGTTIVKEYDWASTGLAFVPADYENRIIELEEEVATLQNKLKNASISNLSVSEVFAPSPQLPADGSVEGELNGNWLKITPEQVYDYIDLLLNKYPRFITKEVMGKDASGKHDWCRYILSRRAYDAWQKPNYPPMYAWVNGSTVIYSESVSPRIGDTLYTTKYIGTAKGTVTAVDNKNQSRTVGGVVYTRDKTKDVEPTLVYTETAYSPYFTTGNSHYDNSIYDNTKAKISTISSMADGTLTGANGVSYIRYPLGDRNSKFAAIPAIVIGGNEHGTAGDPAMPAITSARMIKDLCECKHMNNPMLNLLKNEYMMVFCPVVNPWGLHYDTKSYYNSNGINLDRNFDTPGWGNDTTYPQGDYGGSENETQYFMNTLVASKCKIAMCNHSLGHDDVADNNASGVNREASNAGFCNFMFGRNNSKYDEAFGEIIEVMSANYNLRFFRGNEAPAESYAKTRSYIDWIGAEGGGLEMQSRDGFIMDPDNEAQGKQFTARVMEAAYTQLLQVLYMLIDKQD